MQQKNQILNHSIIRTYKKSKKKRGKEFLKANQMITSTDRFAWKQTLKIDAAFRLFVNSDLSLAVIGWLG